ncbi:polysaccharide deacetylase family protein [Streptomyces sp. NPDC046197]|uniref:polysaccharide deacetylase family protein n=1 Tax=Streptomyces sp. NPDC046197 TaxID=3154337 RepID=UPI0033D154DC
MAALQMVPAPMRPARPEALAMQQSVVPYARLLSVDARLEGAVARPVIRRPAGETGGRTGDAEECTGEYHTVIGAGRYLMGDAIKSDYACFKYLQAMGDHIQNHTLHHPVMSKLPLARQKEEVRRPGVPIKEYGSAPLLFRPPYGAYDKDTESAVGERGTRAIVWWREPMRIRTPQYQVPDKKLRPGDIILAHVRGPA